MEFNLKDVPWEHYRGILATVASLGGSEAVIAGGALRDPILGRPVADVDVFYIGDLKGVNEAFLSFLGPVDEDWKYLVHVNEDDPTYEGVPGLVRTHRIYHPDYKTINLVQLTDMSHVYGDFAADINEVYLTKKDLIMRVAFQIAAMTRTITFTETARLEYVRKTRQKFAGWEFKFPAPEDEFTFE